MTFSQMKFSGPLCLLGCGAQTHYATEILKRLNYRGKVFLVDPIGKGPRMIGNFKVLRIIGTGKIMKYLNNNKIKYFHIAISDNSLKFSLMKELTANGYKPLSLVHPQAVIASSAVVGEGCLINPLVVIGPNARISKCCIIHSLVNIDHDCTLEECVNLAPGVVLAGRVSIGKKAIIYTGANVAPDVRIGDSAIVGAGACVLNDVIDGTTVVGVPSHPPRRAL